MPYPKSVRPQWLGFTEVYAEAFSSLAPQQWDLIRRTAGVFRSTFSDPAQLLWAALVLACARRLDGPDRLDGAERPVWTLAALLGAGFVAAYLPFALSGAYPPQVVGVMSRTNGTGALFAGLFLAAALELGAGPRRGGRAWPRRARRWAAGLFVGACVWTDWYITLTWIDAGKTQNAILAKAAAKVAAAPDARLVVLRNAPAQESGVEVFSEHWGWASALRIVTRRWQLNGLVEKPGIAPSSEGAFIYDFAKDELLKARRP